MRRLSYLAWALLFAVAAALQANDPDPLPWFAVYGAASLVCTLAAWNRVWRSAALLLAAAAFAWAAWIARSLTLSVPVRTALVDWDMHTQGSEELRELLGLLLVVVAAATVASTARVSARDSGVR